MAEYHFGETPPNVVTLAKHSNVDEWPWRLYIGPESWFIVSTAPAWPWRFVARVLLGFRWERR